jgi:hypothetical protein
VIDSPYPDVTRRFLTFRASEMASSDVAHRLYGIFRTLGVEDVTVEALTEMATEYAAINVVMHFDGGIRLVAEHGVVTPNEAERLVAAAEQASREDRFFAALTSSTATACKQA